MPLHCRCNSFTWSFHGWLQLFLREATLYFNDLKCCDSKLVYLSKFWVIFTALNQNNENKWDCLMTLWSRVGSWELLSSIASSVEKTTLLHAQFLVNFSCRPVSQSSPSCWLIVACRYLGLSVDISCSHYPEAHLSISTATLFHS